MGNNTGINEIDGLDVKESYDTRKAALLETLFVIQGNEEQNTDFIRAAILAFENLWASRAMAEVVLRMPTNDQVIKIHEYMQSAMEFDYEGDEDDDNGMFGDPRRVAS